MSAQQSDTIAKASNDLKINLFFLTLGNVDIHYERTTKKIYTFGLSGAINFGDSEFITAVVPFLRLYPFSKHGESMFLEYSMPLYTQRAANGRSTQLYSTPAIGYKHVFTNSGLILEAYLGIGIPIIRSKEKIIGDFDFYPRIGFLIGKRF